MHNWKQKKLNDVCDKISLNKIKIKQKDYLFEGKYPVIDQGQDLIGGYYNNEDLLVPNDPPYIIFGDHTKVKKFIPFRFIAGADGVKVLKAKNNILPKFLYYLLHTIKIENKGYARHFQLLEKETFLIPEDIPEQRAIVKKLESLFSSLDAGVADLKKAQQQLKIYRQAVLKKAFEGELTKEWREKQYTLPDSDEVLKIVEQERENYYNSSIEEWKNSTDKRKAKPQKNKHYSKISNEDYDILPKLPSNWGWEKFGNVCLKIMDGTHFSPKNVESGDYKYITAKNIKEGRIDLKKLSFVTKEDHSEIFGRCDVKKGDILYIKDGATAGIAAVNPFEEEFSLLSSVGVFRTSHNVILPKFMEYYLNAQITKNRMLSNISGVAITRLTLIKLNNSIFIICSPEEQKQIVKEIESRLSVCDSIEQNIAAGLEKAEALRQSILKKAFEGNLLTAQELAECKQADDYEPAGVLLERIKAEQKQAIKQKN